MLYIVGGTVRDLINGKEPKDLDLVVDDARATAEMLCHISQAHYFMLDNERNTVRVYLGQERWQIDISSLQGAKIEDDLGQRDFTINAMAIAYGNQQATDADNILDLLGLFTSSTFKITDQLIDPFGGRQHLQDKLIAKVSDRIFTNDPVRMLRAVRLAGQLSCVIEPVTEQLIRSQAGELKNAPGERLREEFMLILSFANTNVWMEKLLDLGLMAQILPPLYQAWQGKDSTPRLQDLYLHSINAVDRIEELGAAAYAPFMSAAIQLKKELLQQLVPGRSRLQLLKLAGLMHDLGKTHPTSTSDHEAIDNHASIGAQMANDICASLALSRRETETISRLIKHHYRIFEIYHQDKALGLDLFALIEEMGSDFPLLVLLGWADWQSGKTDGIKKEQHFQEFLRFLIREYYENYLIVKSKPLVTGADVMEVLGIGPSPKVGEVLEQVRKSQFMRGLTNREAALAYLHKLVLEA